MDYDSQDSSKSQFNAGVAHVERIDALQRAINFCKMNPLARNIETGTFNFEVMVASADCLVAEGWEKFSPDERLTVERWDNYIKSFLRVKPLLRVSRTGELVINHKNYQQFLKDFAVYERILKEYYGIHELNSPSKNREDDDEL